MGCDGEGNNERTKTNQGAGGWSVIILAPRLVRLRLPNTLESSSKKTDQCAYMTDAPSR